MECTQYFKIRSDKVFCGDKKKNTLENFEGKERRKHLYLYLLKMSLAQLSKQGIKPLPLRDL